MLSISSQEFMNIDQCTYWGFGLLEAPCEHVLHGPLLDIYWRWLCSLFEAPTLEAMLLQRRLFIVLMTAAHISPMSLPSNCLLLTNWASYFNTITLAYIMYIKFTFAHLILYYNILHSKHTSIWRLHFFRTTWQVGCSQSTVSDTLTYSSSWLNEKQKI